MTEAVPISLPRQRGLSLIELLVFIVVVGIAVTGVVSVYSLNARTSADPLMRKQAVAIAESLLEEVLAKPYTYCDPDDAQVTTAQSAVVGPDGCSSAAEVENIGPETIAAVTETRYANLTPFDNVNDYHGFSMTGIRDITDTAVEGLNAYTAAIQVQSAGAFNGIPADETLLVTVTVTAPGNPGVILSGTRTRYAPNL